MPAKSNDKFKDLRRSEHPLDEEMEFLEDFKVGTILGFTVGSRTYKGKVTAHDKTAGELKMRILACVSTGKKGESRIRVLKEPRPARIYPSQVDSGTPTSRTLRGH